MYPPHQQPPSKKSKDLLSRREFLALLALSSGGFAALCGAGTIGAYTLLNNDPSPTKTPFVPDPTKQALLKTSERPPIISRAAWGAREINIEAENEHNAYSLNNPEGWREYDVDLRDAYQTVVIHHSSTYIDDDATTMKAIQNLHMDSREWADIGYHFCVGKNGDIYEGRRLSARGTHTENYNTGSLGICLMGNFQQDIPAVQQVNATQALVNWLSVRLRLTHLASHREFNDITVCPGDNLFLLLDNMAYNAQLRRGTDGYIAPPEQLTPELEATLSMFHSEPDCDCGCDCSGSYSYINTT